jgi:hypothetical protein
MPSTIFAGEHPCQSEKPCTNLARYAHKTILYCGVHAKKFGAKPLQKNPRAKERKQDLKNQHMSGIEEFRKNRSNSGISGQMKLLRLTGRKPVPFQSGWLNIFPNNWHLNRSDGIGMPALSPMRLGQCTRYAHIFNAMCCAVLRCALIFGF